MEKKIITSRDFVELIGNNQTVPRVVYIGPKEIKNKPAGREFWFGVYTYKGEAYVLTNGSDTPLQTLPEEVRDRMLEEIKSGEFKLDPTFQG